MMQAAALDTKESTYKFAAFMDARVKSYAASTHYTEAEKLAAERVRLALELVYRAREVYVTFRKKFVTVKVDAGSVRDTKMLTVLETEYAARGITKAVTAQGIIYRIPKSV
jgi:hypothetical protein